MCGARQTHAIAASVQETAGQDDPLIDDREQPATADDVREQASNPHPWRDTRSSSSERDFYQPRSARNELSLFQRGNGASYGDDSDDEIFSYEPPSHPYRAYVGVVLAVVILALGYMAWRSSQATSQSAHVESQAPPPVATQPAAAAPEAAPSTPQPEAADRRPTTDTVKEAAAPPVPRAADRSPAPKPRSTVEKTSPVEKPNAASDAEKWTQLDTQAGNGSQELAMALRYLNGLEGEPVNKAEAAKWLWKAMAKHNGAATLLLADLYLKGEGVSKNCDQARVLLDSAARAGVKQAGERLRYLQAFGCE
jgi:Sel1 repeat